MQTRDYSYLECLATWDLKALLADYNARPLDTDSLKFRGAVIRELDRRAKSE